MNVLAAIFVLLFVGVWRTVSSPDSPRKIRFPFQKTFLTRMLTILNDIKEAFSTLTTVSGGEYGPTKKCDIFANQTKIRLSSLGPFSPPGPLSPPLTVTYSTGQKYMTLVDFSNQTLYSTSWCSLRFFTKFNKIFIISRKKCLLFNVVRGILKNFLLFKISQF